MIVNEVTFKNNNYHAFQILLEITNNTSTSRIDKIKVKFTKRLFQSLVKVKSN